MAYPLFPDLSAPRRGAQTTRTSTARPAPTPRYGQGNPLLFVTPERTVTPPRKARPNPYPLDSKDPLREWVDAYAAEHREVLTALEHLSGDYHASCGYLRAHRPRTAGPALTFWSAPLSKAHAINALLNRGERTIVQVHEDCDLGKDKLYDYASNWGMTFSRLERDYTTTVHDPQGRTATGRITKMDRATRTGTVRLDDVHLELPVTYDPRARICRTRLPLVYGPDVYLAYPVAARVLNLSADTLRRAVTPDTQTALGAGLLHIDTVRALLPESAWYVPLDKALAAENRCRCPFFDLQGLGCGLDPARRLPDAGTAAYACEDYPS